MKIEVVCKSCGKKFIHNRQNRPRKYCSQACAKSDPEHNRKRGVAVSKAKMGRNWDELYGREESERKRAKLSLKFVGENNPFYGHKHTPESLELMSKSRTGKGVGRKHSPETREKIRQAATGRKLSEETKRKISKARMGVSLKRTKVQKHYKTSQLEAEFQRRHPDAIPKHTAYGYEWDFCWQGWLVEIDGDYWHGLDRAKGFTPRQLNNMKNDQNKNKVVVENKASLLRFKGTRGVDLDEKAYVVICEGELK